MRSNILLSIAALLALGIGLYLVLPRGNQEPGPLAKQVQVAGVMDDVGVEDTEQVVSDSMTHTVREFMDAVEQLDEDASTDELNKANSYLSPSLQEMVIEYSVTRDDFVVLFDQETKAFPPSGYEIVDSGVINEQLEEANVRVSYPGEEDRVYNIELERIDNGWKVVAVNVI